MIIYEHKDYRSQDRIEIIQNGDIPVLSCGAHLKSQKALHNHRICENHASAANICITLDNRLLGFGSF